MFTRTRRDFILQSAMTTVAASSIAGVGTRTASGERPATQRALSLRLAIVGTGQISHRYLKQAAGNERARFVAACARTLASAKARASEYGIEHAFDDYERMYDEVKPDAVVIVTPTAVHAAPAIAAMERGVHVLCEKPMAGTLDECREMVRAAEKNGVVYLNMPYDAKAQFRAALGHVNEATLGVLTGAEAQLLLPGVSRDNWYYDRKVAGGGAGLDTIVYPVSRLISFLGPARKVTGFVNTLIPHRLLGDGSTIDVVPPPRNSAKRVESTVDDNASLLIEWPGGQQAMVRALWGTSVVKSETILYGRRGTLWYSGKDVIVHSPERPITGAGVEAVMWNGYRDCYRIPYQEPANEGLIDHFVDVIQGRATATCGAQQALHVHEILFRGYDAASSGRTQELQTRFTPWHRIEPAFHDTRSRFI